LTVAVTLITILSAPSHSNFLFGIYLFSFIFFTSQAVIFIYIRYEIVMLPLIALILVNGWYRERLYASLVILRYTLLFSLPGIAVILLFQGSWIRKLPLIATSELINFWLALIFIVKLPIWGLHYWLPLAHVEAPTSGRIMLAGILLKLGGYGLVRFNVFVSKKILLFFILGIILATLACCLQLDIKRTIAYSSVSHMIIIPLLLIHNRNLGLSLINIVIFSHGFSSAALFILVGVIYKCTNTRNLILLKGLFYSHPTLVFTFILTLVIRANIPPFIGFFREVFSFLCILQLTSLTIFPIILYFILSLIYIINIFSTMLLTSSNIPVNYEVTSVKESILLIWLILSNIILLPRLEIF